MHRQASASWQFGHDLDQSLHLLLFVRDALGFEVEDAISPPRLAGPVIGHRLLLDPSSTGAVASQWSWWWQSVVEVKTRAQPGLLSGSTDRQARHDELAALSSAVFDPPTWSCLDGRPALQDAVRAVSDDGFGWFTAARAPRVAATRDDVFAWEQVRLGAERAAAEHGVSLDAINGRAQVLMVEGSWWRLVAPGAALCSVGAAHDADAIAAILDVVFGSNLAA